MPQNAASQQARAWPRGGSRSTSATRKCWPGDCWTRCETEAIRPQAAAVATLSGDLLPGWYDDWVLVEAEDWRQLRCMPWRRWRPTHRRPIWGQAAVPASAAVRADPLRESAHAAHIRSTCGATSRKRCASSRGYRALLHAELALSPPCGYVAIQGLQSQSR